MLNSEFIAVLLFAAAYKSTTAYNRADAIRDGIKDNRDQELSRLVGNARASHDWWPNAIVPYEIGPNFSAEDLANIQIAVSDYNTKTCLKWVPRNGEAIYARFIRTVEGTGCAYATGRDMYFENCRSINTFIHEMGHIAGFPHEQDRHDRDFYLSNCDGGGTLPPEDYLHLYDYLSVLHYPCDDCRVPKMKGVPYCGQYFADGRLSVIDAEKINDLYQCNKVPFAYRWKTPDKVGNNTVFIRGGLAVCRGYVEGDILVGTARTTLEACWLPSLRGFVEIGMESGYEILTIIPGVRSWEMESFCPDKFIPPGLNAIAGGRLRTHEKVHVGLCNNLLTDWGYVGSRFCSVIAPDYTRVLCSYGFRAYYCTDFSYIETTTIPEPLIFDRCGE